MVTCGRESRGPSARERAAGWDCGGSCHVRTPCQVLPQDTWPLLSGSRVLAVPQPHPNPGHTTPACLGGQPAARHALRRRNGHTPHRSCQGQALLVFLQTPPPRALGLVCPSLQKRTPRQKEVERTCPRPHCQQEEESGFELRPPDSSPLSPLSCQAVTKMRNPPGHEAEKQGSAGTVTHGSWHAGCPWEPPSPCWASDSPSPE